MPWQQIYDPLNNPFLSTLLAALPVIVLLGCLGILRIKAHISALLGLGVALVVAVLVFGQPIGMAAASTGYGATYGLLPIGWIVFNVMFMYRLTERKGYFSILKESLRSVTNDRRLQVLLIAFCLGGFFEGAAGFGTPVAITAAIMMGLGFSPLAAAGLSLIANTAPVAFGGLGTPMIALAQITGLDVYDLTMMVGRLISIFAVIVPFWLVAAFAGIKRAFQVWPALLVAGGSFAVVELFVSSRYGPWLVNVIAGLVSLILTVLFLLVWKPRNIYRIAGDDEDIKEETPKHSRYEIIQAWMPWAILSVLVLLWGLPGINAILDKTTLRIIVPGLHNMVMRMPPVVAEAHLESAIYKFSWLSASGSGILASAVISGLVMGYSFKELLKTYFETLKGLRYSLLTISAMMALGFVTRFSGLDATLGLTFARTGVLYPFFGTLLGWLGVALTGSDTSSNVLFGSLQYITAVQLGLSPLLMAAANSAGGVMGKMIDAQSIVVASTATGWHGHESDILRYVFWHSLVLASLVGLVVLLFAYVPPFTLLVVQ